MGVKGRRVQAAKVYLFICLEKKRKEKKNPSPDWESPRNFPRAPQPGPAGSGADGRRWPAGRGRRAGRGADTNWEGGRRAWAWGASPKGIEEADSWAQPRSLSKEGDPRNLGWGEKAPQAGG